MRLLDIARGAYVRSPPAVRRSLAPLAALVPTSLRYGGTYSRWRDAIARSRSDPVFADRERTAALRNLLARAYAGSPFYCDRIAAALGTDPDFSALGADDLRRLPVVTKRELAQAGEAALAAPKDQLDAATTSGSNGEFPFAFYLDRDRSVREIAFVNNTWGRTGYAETDARCVLRGFRLDAAGQRNHEWEPALREMRLSVFPMRQSDVNDYVDLIDQRKIRYLHGYPSAIELMCRQMLRLQRRLRLPLKGIFPISEPVYPHQRRAFAAVLGEVPVVPFYGLSERVLFAAEIPGQEGAYEFEPLYGIAELVDENGKPITKVGVEGRVVGTGFLSTGMPFLRYDTEDRATLARLPTRENGWRMQVSAIAPRRKPDFLVGAEGLRIVATDLTPEDPDQLRGISEFQIRQGQPGICTLRYLLDEGRTADDAERLRQYLVRKAEGQLAFEPAEVTSLVAGKTGKRAFIDQRLDLTRY